MRIILVGADFEENLGVGMIAAAAEAAGHRVHVLAYNDPADAQRLAKQIALAAPDVVGLSMQFQHRAHDFLALARRVRQAGFDGHLTCGGQFPTLAYTEVLARGHGVDSVVLHDGEQTFVELLSALAERRPLRDVHGLALVHDDDVIRTPGRGLTADLDALPFPKRYRPPSRHAGIPFVPIMGARGCWGKCTYCSITSFYRDAKAHGGGPTLRLRSPENVAEEMAALWHAAGQPCVFCFHDDNFLLPRPDDSLARLRAIRRHLDELGVGTVGLVGKIRPETLDQALARELRDLGVIRLYVGVENVAEAGAAHLNRKAQQPAVGRALDACASAGIFACYNLLVFEPEATLDDLKQNVAFIRQHASHPVNFCRAEPYYGTPLQLGLAERGQLGGSYLGWNYRITDDRTELAFRICAAVFRERNFRCDGVANRYMGAGYTVKLLEQFHREIGGRRARLAERAESLTRAISRDTADLLDEAIALAERADLGDRDRIERETALFGLRVAAADRLWHHELDGFYAETEAYGERAKAEPAARPMRGSPKLIRHAALTASLALWATGCGDDGGTGNPSTDAGQDYQVVDPPPPDAGKDVEQDWMVVDPPPEDAGFDNMVVDPPPEDAGMDAENDSMVVDPPPPDAGMDALLSPANGGKSLKLIDQWVDTAPKRAVRSDDLPLYDPPEVRIVATREEGRVRAKLCGAPDGATTRWEASGAIEGEGHEVTWTPEAEGDDLLRVAVRTKGGIAVVGLRAKSV